MHTLASVGNSKLFSKILKIVLFGDAGFSPNGSDSECASVYGNNFPLHIPQSQITTVKSYSTCGDRFRLLLLFIVLFLIFSQ